MASNTGTRLLGSPALKSVLHLQSSKIPSTLLKSSIALLSSAPPGGTHSLPDLKYDYEALEPAVSAETMTIHHTKHHNTYVTNLNVTLAKLDSALSSENNTSTLISLQGALRFNGGGHLNHSLFWDNLCGAEDSQSSWKNGSVLRDAIHDSFGSLEALKVEMSAKSIAVQGSGWGWLGYNTQTARLEVATCPNQDPLEATTGLKPILGIDVWEHAYYVDYRNVRPDYVNAIWDIMNWSEAEKRLISASSI